MLGGRNSYERTLLTYSWDTYRQIDKYGSRNLFSGKYRISYIFELLQEFFYIFFKKLLTKYVKFDFRKPWSGELSPGPSGELSPGHQVDMIMLITKKVKTILTLLKMRG